MKIALDYDGTYSADPALWSAFIQIALASGHDVCIVTARSDRLDRTPPLVDLEEEVRVIYTRGIAKKWFLEHFGEFIPDIWIDDRPESIFSNSSMSPAELDKWRAEREDGPHVDI